MTQDALPELISFIESLDLPRILVDLDYRILAANRAYREVYSPRESVVGRHCYEVSHHYARPCEESGEQCPRRAAMRSRERESVLHVHHTPRGEEHVQVDLHPVRDASGDVRFFVERMKPLPTARGAVSPQGLIGRAPRFRATLELVARVAATDTSVLLLGETGTGKELLARLVHEGSTRADAPFVAVDCSGLTESLFESELFGHEKGAFTGATQRKVGLVEAASGGTLFLDEIGDVPLAQQVKLLRLLESNSYRRVGGVASLRADFRLVAATHRDLLAMVRDGSFRSDLYYRISAFPVPVPPLRERPEDVALLADALLARLRPGRHFRLGEAALAVLQAHDFPGNVRELRNVLERASLLTDDECIDLQHLPGDVRKPRALPHPGKSPPEHVAALQEAEREALQRSLANYRGNRRELARALGLSERTLYRKLREHGLSHAPPADRKD